MATEWLWGLSTEQLVFVHTVYDVINQSPLWTIEMHRVAGDIQQELSRRGQLAQLDRTALHWRN
jgi:hypothetical protein